MTATYLVQILDVIYTEVKKLMKKLDILAAILVVVGGLNWGLVALAEFDLVAALFGLDFGETNAATRTVYGLVGLAAVYQLLQPGAILRRWSREEHAVTA
jgi:hypothetical protein